MATPYQIQITMSQDTIAALKSSGYALYGFKAVKNGNSNAAPLVWFKSQRQDLLTNTTINWVEQYQAYISNGQIISGGTIDASNAANMNLGQTANVNKYGNLDAVNKGNSLAISLNNPSQTPYMASGISQLISGKASPMIALPLYGETEEEFIPIEKVLLMFATPTVNTGTVLYQSYTEGVLLDLTAAEGSPKTRAVNYEMNTGWDWGKQAWGTSVPANEDLVPILISGGARRRSK
jgi:hypothetical protein